MFTSVSSKDMVNLWFLLFKLSSVPGDQAGDQEP